MENLENNTAEINSTINDEQETDMVDESGNEIVNEKTVPKILHQKNEALRQAELSKQEAEQARQQKQELEDKLALAEKEKIEYQFIIANPAVKSELESIKQIANEKNLSLEDAWTYLQGQKGGGKLMSGGFAPSQKVFENGKPISEMTMEELKIAGQKKFKEDNFKR